MNNSTISANKRAWQNQTGSGYVKIHKDIRAEAQRVNGTAEDLDSRDSFVELNQESLAPGARVSLYGDDKEFANISMRVGSHAEEAHPSDERSTLVTTKHRYLEIDEVAGSEYIQVTDRFSQDVTKHISTDRGNYEEVLFDDGDTTMAVLNTTTGEAVEAGASLLLGSGWSTEKFEQFMADNA